MAESQETPEISEVDEVAVSQILESLLFASDEPLSAAKIRDAAPQLQDIDLKKLIRGLNKAYRKTGRVFEIQTIAGGYQMFTLPDYAEYVEKLYLKRQQNRLTAKALETLAIIAYKQPVTRSDIEEIRGVNVDGVMKTLLSRNLITIAGTAETPGNPYLYKTTRSFLEYFGLKNIKDLPRLKELDEIAEADTEIKERFGEEFLKEIAPETLGMEKDAKSENGKPEEQQPEDPKPENGKSEEEKPKDAKPENGESEEQQPEDPKSEDGKSDSSE